MNLWIWRINFDKVGYLWYSEIHGTSVTTVLYCTRTSASTGNKSRRERLNSSSAYYCCAAFFSFFSLFPFPFLPLPPPLSIYPYNIMLSYYLFWVRKWMQLRVMNAPVIYNSGQLSGNMMNFPNVGFFFSWFQFNWVELARGVSFFPENLALGIGESGGFRLLLVPVLHRWSTVGWFFRRSSKKWNYLRFFWYRFPFGLWFHLFGLLIWCAWLLVGTEPVSCRLADFQVGLPTTRVPCGMILVRYLCCAKELLEGE